MTKACHKHILGTVRGALIHSGHFSILIFPGMGVCGLSGLAWLVAHRVPVMRASGDHVQLVILGSPSSKSAPPQSLNSRTLEPVKF